MNEVAKPLAFQAMTTDLQVSMDDVVSAFVSQYENNLFDRKKEITREIRSVEEQVERNTKEVRKQVNGDEWMVGSLPLDLTMKITQGEVNFQEKVVKFTVLIETKSNNGYYGNQIKIAKTKPIPAKFQKQHDKLCKELDALRTDLSEVLMSLKSIARKERQVRGRIAIRKLEDSGYASLMQDQELIQLVQLED